MPNRTLSFAYTACAAFAALLAFLLAATAEQTMFVLEDSEMVWITENEGIHDIDEVARTVQQVADEAAGVDAVPGLGDRAERAGEAEPPRDHLGELDRRGRDEPDPLTGVEVVLGELPGAGPDAVGHQLVVDLLAEPYHVLHLEPGDEGERGLLRLRDVVRVLVAPDAEDRLAEREHEQVLGGEQVACGQPAGEVVDGGAPHHRVVDVEERRGRRIGVGARHRPGRGRGHFPRQLRTFPSSP